jgi:predicted house-cleaning noncanonical NTP pyrophosphatase (MazG superfamily)
MNKTIRFKNKIETKLVRDKTPEIFKEGEYPVKYSYLNDQDYKKRLNEKLLEEVDEFLNDDTVEELADILEVVYTLAELKGCSIEKLEKIRQDKSDKKGGFKKKILWTKV